MTYSILSKKIVFWFSHLKNWGHPPVRAYAVFNFSTEWEELPHVPTALPWERANGIHGVGGWVAFGMDTVEKKKPLISTGGQTSIPQVSFLH
jgi:hypothetical protein